MLTSYALVTANLGGVFQKALGESNFISHEILHEALVNDNLQMMVKAKQCFGVLQRVSNNIQSRNNQITDQLSFVGEILQRSKYLSDRESKSLKNIYNDLMRQHENLGVQIPSIKQKMETLLQNSRDKLTGYKERQEKVDVSFSKEFYGIVKDVEKVEQSKNDLGLNRTQLLELNAIIDKINSVSAVKKEVSEVIRSVPVPEV